MASGEAASPGPALSGRCAVVTGAAAGIGRAIVQRLIEHGASVHGLDRDASAQRQLACAWGERYQAHVVDLADRAACDRALLELQLRLAGRCDILINNAGISRLQPFASSDDAVIDSQFAINVVAAFRITRSLLPALRASGRGVIVNMASELALVGAAGYSVYCATKGALLAWSRALAVELAAEGIRVNAVCPGPIDTALLQQEFASYRDPNAARAAEVATVPLGRLGTPSDIAAVVAFLASDAAAFATGAAWTVDGGKTAR
jgi:NAD(P)-dependent dehydrogenase (short-subunit alcohol dehydrogenase family)